MKHEEVRPKSKVVKRVASYFNSSVDKQYNVAPINYQMDLCYRFIELRGWTHVKEYIDDDISVSTKAVKGEVKIQQLLSDAKSGMLDAIIVYSFDIFELLPLEVPKLVRQLNGYGVEVWAAFEGQLVIEDPFFSIYENIQTLHVESINLRRSDRARQRLAKRARNGIYRGRLIVDAERNRILLSTDDLGGQR